jgi:hypothetical protein
LDPREPARSERLQRLFQAFSRVDRLSRSSTTKLVDLLQGYPVGRNHVRENWVLPAVAQL